MRIETADAMALPLDDQSVDLVFGSPPYINARTYDDGTLPEDFTVSRDCRDWVDWMLRVTAESLRVSRGAVVWIAAAGERKHTYQPAVEGLLWRWFDERWTEAGSDTATDHKGKETDGSSKRPAFFHRFGIPGSGGRQWLRADVEYVAVFKRPGPLPWADPVAMGKPCKFPPGGRPSHRTTNGERVDGEYTPPELANPGNLISCKVGGGHMGDQFAHENEAPFPESLAEFVIRTLCPPEGVVVDPFCGSGTTLKVARNHGRDAIGFDVRSSQVELSRRRVDAMERGS